MIIRKALDRIITNINLILLRLRYPKRIIIGKNFKVDQLHIELDKSSKIHIGDNVRFKVKNENCV